MSTVTLSAGSGAWASLAVRAGLGLASWGIKRAARRTDRDWQLSRMQARAAATAALAEREALYRSAAFRPL